MKFFAVFSALLAVALAGPGTWTLHELSEAIQNPTTDPALIPILEEALNNLILAIVSGSPQDTITVATPVQDLSTWTLAELDAALQNPATDPALVPYLEVALNSMMEALITGNQPDFVIVATPVGLLPVESVVPAPVESEVVPSPAEGPAASPLVQIIINVRSQEAASPAPIVPEFNPVVPEPVVLPAPVLPEVVPSPVVLPQPVLPEVQPEVNPIDIIAVNPVVFPVVPEPVVLPAPVLPEVNPVDIIAVNPGVAVNPVDILHPVPVVAPVNVVDGIIV